VNSVISGPSRTTGMNPDNFTHKTNEGASVADCNSYGEENTKQKQQIDNTLEEPDEYYKQQQGDISQDERAETYKQQPDKIVEGKPDEYGKTLERPAVKRSPDCLRVFTLDELMSATSNFSEEHLLGDGGTIYKGTIDGKHMVAITKFTCANWPAGCVIDQSALEYLGMMRHPHLVRLLGYCNQGEHNITIHEYMPRGSLKYHLSLETNLIASVPWLMRLNIAVGAAKGLSFLHKSSKQMMLCTAFKASSILLGSVSFTSPGRS